MSLALLPIHSQGPEQKGRKYQEDVMRKTYLITAILLLSSVWVVAQTSPGTQQPANPSTSAPSQTSPSQQPTVPDSSPTATQQTSQTATDSSTAIEGCLSGSAGNFTLTDQSGKAWQLAGDTSKLSDHVGHQVRIMGNDASSSAAGASPSSGAPASSGAGAASGSTFTVKKVKMISTSCPTSK